MNFDIETNQTKRAKKNKKRQKINFLLICFFSIMFLILLIVYLILLNGNHKPKAQPIKNIEKEESSIHIYDEYSNDRPIAFMIDNNIGEAKHAGLQESYLNYEIIVEGGLTRIMAIYKDNNVNLIGPIRSSRHYFLDYAAESDAIYAHFGWSPQAEQDIKELGINNINGLTDQEPFRRDDNAIAPHNVFTNITYIKQYLNNKNYSSTSSNWKLLNMSSEEINIGDEAESTNAIKINLTYSSNEYRTYTYDETNKYYLRSQNGTAHIDRQTNKQLHYKNIIIIKVPNKTIDSTGRQDLETIGNGEGYYITNGKYSQINWTKESRLSKMSYNYNDGTNVKLNDGNTFIQIVPINSKITIE